MKTVVITGSARGLGLEMAKVFRKNQCNVMISDLNQEKLNHAKEILKEIPSTGDVATCICDVTKEEEIKHLVAMAKETFQTIDIWINNAGINQPDKPIWELELAEIEAILNVDLKGAILGSKWTMREMMKQGHGAIYNIEGYGSNDAMMLGLSLYGTSKRAITYFTRALAKESEEKNTGVLVGRSSPGIMITDFIQNALGDKEKIELPEKTKKVYNILGDYPDVVASFLVEGMLKNTKNDSQIVWLTNRKAAWRFMTSAWNKRDFFRSANEK